MPQMAPLMWLSLMGLFLALYLMNTMKLYFVKQQYLTSSKSPTKKPAKKINWKW